MFLSNIGIFEFFSTVCDFLKEYFIGILVYLLFDREPHILVSKHL